MKKQTELHDQTLARHATCCCHSWRTEGDAGRCTDDAAFGPADPGDPRNKEGCVAPGQAAETCRDGVLAQSREVLQDQQNAPVATWSSGSSNLGDKMIALDKLGMSCRQTSRKSPTSRTWAPEAPVAVAHRAWQPQIPTWPTLSQWYWYAKCEATSCPTLWRRRRRRIQWEPLQHWPHRLGEQRCPGPDVELDERCQPAGYELVVSCTAVNRSCAGPPNPGSKATAAVRWHHHWGAHGWPLQFTGTC